MSLYRHIIRQAMTISWQHKYLWFFGLFAALVGSGGYEIVGQSVFGSSDTVFWLKDIYTTGIFGPSLLSNLKELAITQTSDLFVFGIAAGIFVVLGFFFFWLATVSQAAIVNSVASVNASKEHDYHASFKVGVEKFWPVFAVNVLVKLAIFIALVIVNLPLLSGAFANAVGAMFWLYITSVIVLVPIFILFSFLMKYVISYVVIKGDDLVVAFKRSWLLFSANWLVSIEMAFMLFIISFVISVVAILVLSLFLIPAIFVFVMAVNYFGSLAVIFVIAISGLVGLAIMALFSAFNSVFQATAWTSLFLELSSRGLESKLQRVFGKYVRR